MPFRPPFVTVGELFFPAELNYFLYYFIDLYKIRLTALVQPLRMIAHTLDCGDLLNRCCMGSKGNTKGGDVCGGSCVDVGQISRTSIEEEQYWWQQIH
jgi:hypothetical protein